ncbi:hypothetical protein ACGFMO_10850 [Streptomyces niveus]|uniref:hypothetical protein n=1 Tax=Streptomyces niveus TaxID=193462 RepID=UPI00371ED5A8
MPHTTRKHLARRRTAYTGESYQQAYEALRACPVPLPEAADDRQRRLESRIMITLTSTYGTAPPRTWMPSRHPYDSPPPLGVEKARPTAAGLELVVSPRFTTRLAEAGLIKGDLPVGDRYELVDPADDPTRPPARVVVRVRSPRDSGRGNGPGPGNRRSRTVVRRAIEPAGVLSLALNPRWACRDFQMDSPEHAPVGSQLLRRAALFADSDALRWITTWTGQHGPAPLTYAEWLPDRVPVGLAVRLADPVFGVAVPKSPEEDPWERWSGEYRYHAGPELDRIIAGLEPTTRLTADTIDHPFAIPNAPRPFPLAEANSSEQT